jgi:ATP-dependent Zn protease
MLTMLMAGRAAEQLVLKRVSSGSAGAGDSDLARATRLAFDMERILGFGSEHPLLYRPRRDPGAVLDRDPELAARVHARLEAALERAAAILRRRRPTFNALAKALFDAQAMDEEAVLEILTS